MSADRPRPSARRWARLLGGHPAASIVRFLRDTRGATVVEFGLLAVPFLGVLTAIFEIAYVDFTAESLQSAVTTASRDVLTGNLQKTNFNNTDLVNETNFINNYICPKLYGIGSTIDCSRLKVDMRTATTFAGVDMTNDIYTGTNIKFCPGQPGQITVLRVTYPLVAIFPISIYNQFVGLVNNVPDHTGWYHIVMGSALFQTEPYTTSYTPPPTCS